MWKISDYPSLVLPATAVLRLGEGMSLDLEACDLASREAYMAFVVVWKGAVKALADAIREQKALRRTGSDADRSQAQIRREILRIHARRMFELRRITKAASRDLARRMMAA